MNRIYDFQKFYIRKKIKNLQNEINCIYNKNNIGADLFWLEHSRVLSLKKEILELQKNLEEIERENEK